MDGHFTDLLRMEPIYPGSPKHRKVISLAEYSKWITDGRPQGLVDSLYDHPTHLRCTSHAPYTGNEVFEAGEFGSSCRGHITQDASGRPIHPDANKILVNGLGIEGPGAYWHYGPNVCADPIVLGASRDGYLRTIVVLRRDTKIIAPPGGYLNPGESGPEAAIRELREETGIKIPAEHLSHSDCLGRFVVPDSRTTLNAWPESYVIIYILQDRVIDEYRPIGQDDAENAMVATVDRNLFCHLSGGHEDMFRLAVARFKSVAKCSVNIGGHIIPR